MKITNNIPQHLFAYLAIFHSDWKKYHPWIETLLDENPISLAAITADRSTREVQSLLAQQLQDPLHRNDQDSGRNRAERLTLRWPYLMQGKPTDTFVTFEISFENYEYYILNIVDDRKQMEPVNFTFPHLIGDAGTAAISPC